MWPGGVGGSNLDLTVLRVPYSLDRFRRREGAETTYYDVPLMLNPTPYTLHPTPYTLPHIGAHVHNRRTYMQVPAARGRGDDLLRRAPYAGVARVLRVAPRHPASAGATRI